MEHQSRSSLIKLLFAEDESVVSSTISEDAAEENQTQSQDELTNPNPSNTMDTSENDNVSILGSESVAKKHSKTRKRDINSVYEDQHINGDEMPIDSSKSQRRSSRVRKTTDTFILSDVNTQKSKPKTQVDDSDEHGDSFVQIKKSKKVDEREKIVKSPVKNEYTCLYYAMFNSLRTEKHRMAFSKGNLQHPSKAFVDFMINDQTPKAQFDRINKEGYTALDMLQYLLHLKDNGWIKEFQWQKQKCEWNLSNFFCSGSVTPENHILFALSLTSNMKKEAIKRMKEVNNDYLKNEKKYRAEGKTLCHLQHEEYLKFYNVFINKTKKINRHPHGGALQRDDKGKTYYFDSGKEYVMYEPTLDQIYCLLTNLYKSMRFQIVCDDEDVNFAVQKGKIRKRKPRQKKKNKDKK